MYIVGCVNRLGRLAARDDDVGEKTRSDLGRAISSLVCHGFVEAVEEAIQRVVGAGCSWSLALRQLKAVLARIMREGVVLGETQEPPCGTNVVSTSV